jgi:hypothetical protein
MPRKQNFSGLGLKMALKEEAKPVAVINDLLFFYW